MMRHVTSIDMGTQSTKAVSTAEDGGVVAPALAQWSR
jgi:sugar (pentulose or hexulose) kinase